MFLMNLNCPLLQRDSSSLLCAGLLGGLLGDEGWLSRGPCMWLGTRCLFLAGAQPGHHLIRLWVFLWHGGCVAGASRDRKCKLPVSLRKRAGNWTSFSCLIFLLIMQSQNPSRFEGRVHSLHLLMGRVSKKKMCTFAYLFDFIFCHYHPSSSLLPDLWFYTHNKSGFQAH